MILSLRAQVQSPRIAVNRRYSHSGTDPVLPLSAFVLKLEPPATCFDLVRPISTNCDLRTFARILRIRGKDLHGLPALRASCLCGSLAPRTPLHVLMPIATASDQFRSIRNRQSAMYCHVSVPGSSQASARLRKHASFSICHSRQLAGFAGRHPPRKIDLLRILR